MQRTITLSLMLALGMGAAVGCKDDKTTDPDGSTAGTSAGAGTGAGGAGAGGAGAGGAGAGGGNPSQQDANVDDSDSGKASDAAVDAGPTCTKSDAMGCIDIVAGNKSDFGTQWSDSWFIMGCPKQDGDGHDCKTIDVCPNQGAADFEDNGAISNETFPLGGEKGTTYAVSIQFNGIAEGKYYKDGSFAKPDVDVATTGGPDSTIKETENNDGTFYIGGKAVATDYNVMRLRVLDSDKNEVGRYYLNAYPNGNGAESHRTFRFSYHHTIDVPGQGFIEHRFQDKNCKAVDNCNDGNVVDGTCNESRKIPNEPDAKLPLMFNDVASATQPHLVPTVDLDHNQKTDEPTQPWHAQIAHLTITKIVPK